VLKKNNIEAELLAHYFVLTQDQSYFKEWLAISIPQFLCIVKRFAGNASSQEVLIAAEEALMELYHERAIGRVSSANRIFMEKAQIAGINLLNKRSQAQKQNLVSFRVNLTDFEQAVIILVGSGFSYEEIAMKLHSSLVEIESILLDIKQRVKSISPVPEPGNSKLA